MHHLAHYEDPVRYAQLVWAALTIGALLATVRMARPSQGRPESVAETSNHPTIPRDAVS